MDLESRYREAMELLRQTTFDAGAISAHEWERRYKALKELPPLDATPKQKGWHFWAFDLEEDDEGEGYVLAMLGPKMQAASFTVPKTSLRVEVLKQFMADMQSDSANGEQHGQS